MNFDRVTEYLKNIPQNQLPCIDVMVFHHGKEVYRYMNGTCDYLRQKPVGENTLYWVYSMTKPITMTAVMQCVEKGIIGLEDYVSDYIPAFDSMQVRQPDGSLAPAQTKIRVKHLLTMTSGLDYNKTEPALLEAQRDRNASTESLVNAIAQRPLRFEPGSDYKYSFSHDVAARVLEVATGMTFGQYLQENIFEPLGMNQTTFRETPEIRARLAAQFKRDDEADTIKPHTFANAYILSDAYESGGAGLISSTADYGKFVAAMSTAFTAEHPLLGQSAIELMRTPHISDAVAEKSFSKFKQGYSYGLGVRTMKYPEKENARSPVGEFGWDGAAGSIGMIDPENEIGLVYLTQVLGSQYSYFTLFPELRDLIYQALQD